MSGDRHGFATRLGRDGSGAGGCQRSGPEGQTVVNLTIASRLNATTLDWTYA